MTDIASGVAGPRGNLLARLLESGEQRVLWDASRQQQARQAGIPCTVVQAASVLQAPGGQSELSFAQV